jgi:maltooligosyltrehalose trehalohydrolase
MGEEWGASTPWQYFTDHENDDLANAVRDGRRAEFASFGWKPEDVPDPQDPATFDRSRLNWSELMDDPHQTSLEWYRALIRLRKEWPDLCSGERANVDVHYDEDAHWLVMWRGRIGVIANLSGNAQRVPLTRDLQGNQPQILLASTDNVVTSHTDIELPAHAVVIALM